MAFRKDRNISGEDYKKRQKSQKNIALRQLETQFKQKMVRIGHFRVAFSLSIKARLGAKPFNDVKMSFYSHE